MNGKETSVREQELLRFERRVRSLLEDPSRDQEVMKRSEERLREAMTTSPKRHRRWRSSLAGAMAIATAGLAVAMLTSAVHTGLIHLGSTAPKTTAHPTAIATQTPPPLPPSCRLPVTTDVPARTGDSYSHGFVTYPGGAYVADQTVPGRSLAYDVLLGRWLPFSTGVALQSSFPTLSPDGRSFVYVAGIPVGPGPARGGSSIHVVDLVGGGDRVIWRNNVDFAQIFGYTELGIVFGSYAPPTPVGTKGSVDAAALGDWLLNPVDGTLRKISIPVGEPYTATGTSVWWVNPVGSQLVRTDLRTGAADVWLSFGPFQTVRGQSPQLVGFDNQYHPVLRFGSRDPGVAYSVVIVVAPNKPVVIYSGHQGDATDFDPTEAYGDGRGIWFGNFFNSIVWLYHGGILEKIQVSGLPLGSKSNIDIAGPCS